METAAPAERWSNRALFRLLWPLIVEQFLAVTIGMVDTVMVTTVGEAAVSGVSVVDAVNILLITAFTALATGGAVVVSQFIGRGDVKNGSLAARQLVYTVSLVAVVFMLVAAFFCRPILSLIYGQLDAAVLANAETYFVLSAVSYPFIALYNAGAALFRSMGNSRVTMLVAGLVNILNIVGNSVLIYGFNMGVAGAAISTLISRAVAAAVLIVLLVRAGEHQVNLRGLHKVKLVPKMVSNILRIGVPNGLESSMFQIGKLMVARIITTFGTAIIAGNAIANALASLAFLPGQAFSMALLTVVGQCIGAGDYASARRYTRKLMLWAYITVGVICGVLLLVLKPLLGLFSLSDVAMQYAYDVLIFYYIQVAVLWLASFALPNALRAAGDARFTMVISIFSMWVFRIGFAVLLSFYAGFGPLGVWYAMVPDWTFRSIAFILRWWRGKWTTKRVIK